MQSLPLALFVGLLGAGAPWATSPDPAAPVRSLPVGEETYEALEKEYQQNLEEYQEARREAETAEERKHFRDNHPTKAFLPRFQALAKAGDGRGTLWEVDNLRYMGFKSKERKTKALELYQGIVENSPKADWFPSALEHLAAHSRLKVSEKVNLLKRVPQGSDIPEANRIATQFHMGAVLKGLLRLLQAKGVVDAADLAAAITEKASGP